jgi:hypothetical protein
LIEAIQFYKKFIDDFVNPIVTTSVYARRVREWEKFCSVGNVEREQFNQIVQQLSPEQRNVVADMLQDAHESGIFHALRYLSDEIYFGKLRISVEGVELPVEPFGMTLYEDWVGRMSGEYAWPDERSTGNS